MKSRRNRRRDFRRFTQDEFMARPAQKRSAAEIERVSKILAEIGGESQRERSGK
jgi:hypothetical protein